MKNILNRYLINLVNCDQEPIHIPGSIQPHGFLFVVSQPDFIIDYCSANTHQFLQQRPEELLGKPFADFFPPDQVAGFKDYLDQFIEGTTYPYVFTIDETPYNTIIQNDGSTLLLEFEPFPDGNLSLPDLYHQTRNFISFIESANYLRDLCQSVANHTRSITGYDRVMIYRFDEDYNGEVFAESKRSDLQSFLDHRYPHTDIPAQARSLYMRNLLRIIVDVHYEPVPLLAKNDKATHASVDLSNAVLRSVSPIHIEYLKNIGVGATLTISLIHQGKLWGLIACHHYAPRNLPHYTRLAAQLQGHFLTSQISVREAKEEYDRTRTAAQHLQALQHELSTNVHFIEEQYTSPHLLALAGAQGVVIRYEGRTYAAGKVPEMSYTDELITWLQLAAPGGYLVTDHLISSFPEAAAIAGVASGIIYYALSNHLNDCIIWFRPEVVQTIDWAGDPNKAVLAGEDQLRLSPRKSFDLWRQVVKFKSTGWKKTDLNMAASFAYALQKYVLNQYLSREEARYRKLSEQLQEANEELANINWISTHDLKEPLRKIQIFGSRIIENEKDKVSDYVLQSVQRMRSAANRMQILLDDILNYSHLSHKEQAFTAVDMNSILDEIKAELQDELDQKGAVITAGRLPVIYGIAFQIRQLFINLIGNAMKFAREATPLVLQIHSELVDDRSDTPAQQRQLRYHKISFEDNGIGFDETYASRIFEVFQRLHPGADYGGTGIGLSICKKIMTNHQGTIAAQSKAGSGATFILCFPENRSPAATD